MRAKPTQFTVLRPSWKEGVPLLSKKGGVLPAADLFGGTSSKEVVPLLSKKGGYTLVELMVVLSIIGILSTIVFNASWQHMRNKTEAYQCTQNLRSLHMALTSYMDEHDGQWPQMPEDEMVKLGGGGGTESEMWEWWYKKLNKYGLGKNVFLCPTDHRERGRSTDDNPRDEFESSYIFPFFDAGTESPYNDNQPWVMERSGFHTDGNLEIMPDGRIRTSPWVY